MIETPSRLESNSEEEYTNTPWSNKNASILFGIIFQKLINKN